MTTGSDWLTILDRDLALVRRMADGVSHEDSLGRPIAGGSSFNWLVGHLVVSRDDILELLGHDQLAGPEIHQLYARGSRPPGDDEAVDFERLLRLFEAQGAALHEAVEHVDAGALERPREGGASSVGAFVGFLVWHEAYHAGQAVLYRRAVGLESPIG